MPQHTTSWQAATRKARGAFATLVGRYGDDPLALFHLQRLLGGKASVRIELLEKWAGGGQTTKFHVITEVLGRRQSSTSRSATPAT